MAQSTKWITPFKKQCFVVIGASINLSQLGMVFGIATSMLPELRGAGGAADDDVISWVAAIPGLGLALGNLIVPILMVRYGRKKANLISILTVILGWTCVLAGDILPVILAGRLLQGVSNGMSICLTPILIGESTSPKNRGAFIVVMSLFMAASTFAVHMIGYYASWKITALVCVIITVTDLIMVLFTPETPNWLADRGMFEECERTFRWLRGDDEEEELARMIQESKASKQTRKTKVKIGVIRLFLSTVTKKEFYKPIVIMIHLNTICQWSGINILSPYMITFVESLAGRNVDMALVVVSVDMLRMVFCVIAVFIIRKVRRRSMLLAIVGLNSLVFLALAVYSYTKDMVPLHPAIGILLIHLLMATVASGSLPLPFTISGEIFPLRYKGVSSGSSSLFGSINLFLCVYTFPALQRNIGLHGTCLLNASILAYCLIVVWFLLPETKDRTLQEVEDALRGKVSKVMDDEVKSAQPLTAFEEA